MTFPIGCNVSFCSKTLPLNTSSFEETVFEKSRVFNLSRFKISICIWWRFVRVRTFEITEWIVCSVLLESTVINFGVNREIKVFPRKVIMLVCRRNVSSAPRWTHYHFVFLGITFRVDLWNVFLSIWKLSLWKVPALGRRRTIVVLRDKR